MSDIKTRSDWPLPYFTALHWYNLSGRGDVAAVTLDRDCLRSEMMTLFSTVLIDQILYDVKGIETFAVERQRRGWEIGFLVEKRKISRQECLLIRRKISGE